MKKYISETITEMRHNVAWPTYTELQKSSVLVLVGTLVFALVVGTMDYIYDAGLSLFYNQF
ncbi:preprotein translocase subunit SecE [Adhaeribacter soli]|uniref:preprotein translocase subunit SecE n=1 Tax=Adhaeribacter soli TaxID=2607655 RepID=UPI002939399D|nr:preprotein translocase subunit SecE [Adhaeribacter soli]